MPHKKEFQAHTERIEELAAKLERTSDPEMHATAMELLQCVMELHGTGLQRVLEIVHDSSGQGELVIDSLVSDELVASLLLLHGLHPDSLDTRVQRALEKVRPYLHSHGGDVELLSLDDGRVHVRLQGSCGSCPSSSITLKNAVEEAIVEAAPDVIEIVAENTMEQASSPALVVLK